MGRPRTNWHSAAADAIRITLRDYEDILEYHREYVLSGGAHRIDLLIIHKLSDIPIPHPIAKHFSEYNLFEIKGISSSVTIDSYYKTIAYASLLIAENHKAPPHYRKDISLTFVCMRYPRKLVKYLTGKCKMRLANPYPGIYNISGDIFPVQIMVTGKLPPETALYLRCLTNNLPAGELVEQLAQDYTKHQSEPLYENYMDQLINANLPEKGDSPMCCEGIFRLYGTSSKEIAANAAKEAVAPVMEKLNKATEELNKTTEDLNQTTETLNQTTETLNQTTENFNKASKELDTAKKEIDYLKQLLAQHGIAYNC